jgi:hypothetical protein
MADAPANGGLVPQPVPQDERDTLFGEIERTGEIGGYIWEPGRRLVWSAGMFRLLEIEPAAGQSATAFFDRVHPEDRAQVMADWQRAQAQVLVT